MRHGDGGHGARTWCVSLTSAARPYVYPSWQSNLIARHAQPHSQDGKLRAPKSSYLRFPVCQLHRRLLVLRTPLPLAWHLVLSRPRCPRQSQHRLSRHETPAEEDKTTYSQPIVAHGTERRIHRHGHLIRPLPLKSSPPRRLHHINTVSFKKGRKKEQENEYDPIRTPQLVNIPQRLGEPRNRLARIDIQQRLQLGI